MSRTKRNTDLVPQVKEFVKPTVEALISLGGSGSIQEINDKVYEITQLSDEVLNIPHANDGRSQVDYRLAWARTRLKLLGIVENSSKSVWTLTKQDFNIDLVNFDDIQQRLDKERRKNENKSSANSEYHSTVNEENTEIAPWWIYW